MPTFAGLNYAVPAAARRLARGRLAFLLLCFAGGLGGVWSAGTAGFAQEPLLYNRDIRPILAENCFACHGPDSASRKADLRLDQQQAAIDYGAIAPHKPEESSLIERIQAEDPEQVMPPPATKKSLTAKQKELLRRWIQQGAEYQLHWSLIPPQRPALPSVKQTGWVRNPLDQFILARLEQTGLSPAPEADRYTLARRLSLDLTGLPPSPEVVEQFVNDTSADAYERLVDRLMATPQWGEHRARYWLDVARYADTHGIHFDNYREIWAYRDWVISAFNRNLPFDQFTVEQLAGDLLPQATLDQKIASGFNRCNITTNEGGIIDEEYVVLYARDRTETTAQTWLGLTAGCAVCHNHKFDPLTMHDFYSLSAFFNNTTQAARDGNIKDTPPIIVVPQPADRPQWDALQGQSTWLKEQIADRKQKARGEFDQWLAEITPEQLKSYIPTEGLHFAAPLSEGQGQEFAATLDGTPRSWPLSAGVKWVPGREQGQALSLQPGPAKIELPEVGDFEGDQPISCSVWLSPARRGQTGAVLARMDNTQAYRGWDLWMEGDKIGMHLVHQWPDDALKVVCQTPLQPRQFVHVCVTYDGSRQAKGIKIYYNGVVQPTQTLKDALRNTTRTTVPLKLGQRHTSEALSGITLTDLKLFRRSLSAQEVEQLARLDQVETLLAQPAEKRATAEVQKIFEWWLATLDEPSRNLDAQLKQLAESEAQIKSRGTVAHVMNEKPAQPLAYILFRGEYDKRRDQVAAQTPEFLPAFPENLPRNRLGLAQWLLLPDQPLTARVTVNRFWQELYGTGLVRTAGDFGVSGELPSHPELLDWLAVEFRESGWDIKRLFKLLVTSSAYRQQAVITPQKRELDPQNRLLSRGPRFRLDAEVLRDYALAASGLLVPEIGGPSVKPYQPEGVWEAVAMIGSNTRDYRRDTGSKLYRRSLYTFWKRSAPPASMEILNAPNRETCVVRRDRTNTPLQALVTLNDVQFVESARHLAQRVLLETAPAAPADKANSAANAPSEKRSGDEARIDRMARYVLCRPLRPAELSVLRDSLSTLRGYYDDHAEAAQQLIATGESKPDATLKPVELAAWTLLANELMNLDEVLSK